MGILADYLSPSIEELLRSKLLLKKEDIITYSSPTVSSSRKRVSDQSSKKNAQTKKVNNDFLCDIHL